MGWSFFNAVSTSLATAFSVGLNPCFTAGDTIWRLRKHDAFPQRCPEQREKEQPHTHGLEHTQGAVLDAKRRCQRAGEGRRVKCERLYPRQEARPPEGR